MRGGWAIWLVSAAGSLATHFALMSALSGMTLPPAPPPLADLYIGDAASDAPLEVEAVEEATSPLEAAINEDQQVAALSTDSEPVAETPVTTGAEAVEPVETSATGTEEIEASVPQVQAAEEAGPQATLDAPAELPEAAAPPVTETEVQPPELTPGETAASSPVAEIPTDVATPADNSTSPVEPKVSDATAEAGVSRLAENDTSAPALESSVEPPLPAVEPDLSPSTEAVAPETAANQAEGVSTAQTAAEAREPPVEATQSTATAVAGTEASATVSAAPPRQEPKEPVASAPTQSQDTSTRVEQEQQMAALPPVSEFPMTQRERIRRFAGKGFDLGACGLMEIAGQDSDRPRLNGFLTSADALKEVGSDFRRSVGVYPEITMRQVMEAQCPAVNFIGKLRRSKAPAISVKLATDVIRGNNLLVGRLARATLPHLLLFIVDDDGIVHNLTADLLSDAEGHGFVAEVHPTAEGKSRNQLLVAVGSTEPLDVSGPGRVGGAAIFLSRLQEQAAAEGARLSLGYATFRVE